MAFFDLFSDDDDRKDNATARKIFEQTVGTEGDSREKRALRVRQAVRIQVVIDKIFIAGTKNWAGFQEERMIAIAGGEDAPRAPVASEEHCYQNVNTVNGSTKAYIPLVYAGKIFDIGVRYEKGEIDGVLALNLCQEIANEIGDLLKLDLYAVQPILPLGFLFTVGEDPAEEANDSDG